MQKITPILLAGGTGERLWPLSRKSYPKQFSSLLAGKTLFQQSAKRLASTEDLDFNPLMIMTTDQFRFIVLEQLNDIGISPGRILIEPEGKNTAPAILAASILAFKEDENALLLVLPSDHVIPDVKLFQQTVRTGCEEAQKGKIVTFGIEPTSAETGYGYLEVADRFNRETQDLLRFIEKPDQETANKMLSEGNYFWNAGIFLFRAKDMINAFEKHASHLVKNVNDAVENAKADLGFLRLDPMAWSACIGESIDYAIMEKLSNISVVPFFSKWSDLGSWDAVWKEMSHREDGVVVTGNSHAIDCNNVLLRAEHKQQHLVGLGLSNLIAIAMPDAVLVADKSRSQEIKIVVEELRSKNIQQAEVFPKDHRPWGWFESLTISDRFQVKRIHVHPGAALSLQSHNHRSEHWIVVEGTAKVTVDDAVKLITEGQSVYIPLGATHRLENPGKIPMIIIEVQTGPYLSEDDIIRYSDIYDRL